MYNPINRILKATRETGSYKKFRPHWSVTGLELASLLSFLPGMFIFLYAFVPSAVALFAAFEISKGNYALSIVLFTFFNIFLGVFGVIIAIADESLFNHGLATAIMYGGLGIWGVAAAVVQKRICANSS